jgi:CheY-like chemotaxis protein
VSSQPLGGSTFWFTIRVQARSAEDSATGAEPAPRLPATSQAGANRGGDPPQGSSGRRVLLAEDNLINQKVAVAMLTNAGYVVDSVLNGNEAVRANADGRYDAILMDCQMPELNGYEATAAIRAQEGPARHTPIIALTAGARSEDRDRCIAAGMDDYLSKPMSKDALLSMVGRLVTNQLDPAGAA